MKPRSRDIPGLVAVVHDRRFRRRRRRARGKRGQGRGAAQGQLEADADAAGPEGRRDRAARQSVDAAHADRQGRRRRGASPPPTSRCSGPMSGRTRCTARSARPARSRMFATIGVRVWSGTQNPHLLRADLALLLQRPETEIDVIRMEAAGCYGRNCADDVSADAVLLSRAVGRPVRVQLTREQEHAWEPKGTAQLMDVNGGLNADGSVAGLRFRDALSVQRRADAGAAADRNDSAGARRLRRWATAPRSRLTTTTHMRVVAHDMPPIVRASWLRGVSALPNTFAHESYIDELATEAGVDPIEYRLRYLKDPRAVDLVNAVAERAGWTPRPVRKEPAAEGDIVRGRGFAYALYVHSKFPGYGAAWSAWIADVAVNKATGDVSVTRVVAGQDSGLMINPDGVRHQIHGNVIQSTSRALMEEVSFDRNSVTSREWGAYPIINFPDIPKIDVLMLPRQDQPPLGVGESASVPSAAAIANAIFDATGVRFRELPFTPERILAGLRGEQPAPQAALPERRRAEAGLAHASKSVCQAARRICRRGRAWLPRWSASPRSRCRGGRSRRSRGRIRRPIRRRRSRSGQQLAALGDCAVCHTASERRDQRRRPRRSRRRSASSTRTNITPDRRNRHRRMVLSRLRARDARGHPSRRPASLSGVSLSRILPRPPTPTCRRSTPI